MGVARTRWRGPWAQAPDDGWGGRDVRGFAYSGAERQISFFDLVQRRRRVPVVGTASRSRVVPRRRVVAARDWSAAAR